MTFVPLKVGLLGAEVVAQTGLEFLSLNVSLYLSFSPPGTIWQLEMKVVTIPTL